MGSYMVRPAEARENRCAHGGLVAAIYPAYVWSILTPGPDGNTRVPVLIRLAVSKTPDPSRFAETQDKPLMPSQ